MGDTEFRKGERCGVGGCRSKRYRTNTSGFLECQNGHQHGMAQFDAEDDEGEYGMHIGARTFKAKKEEKKKVQKLLKGEEAFEQFLLCYQHVLRKQVWWLIHEKKLPPELETIVHDLWALRLQKLRSRLSAEDEPQAEEDPDQAATPELASDTEGEDGMRLKNSQYHLRHVPTLPQALALQYIATQILRLPVFLGDILSWAKSGFLLYHDALDVLPSDLTGRLPPYHQMPLKPRIVLTDYGLFDAFRSLVLFYSREFGLEMPALNLPLHLYRMVEEFALPLEVYSAVRRLATWMKLDFKYPSPLPPPTTIFDWPEGQLIACVVIVIKLFYGFDGLKRYPGVETSPAVAVIDWDVWAEQMHDFRPLEYQDAMQMSDSQAIQLTAAKIDDYFDFFSEHFTVPDPSTRDSDADFRRMMLNLFPVNKRVTRKRDDEDYDRNKIKNERLFAVQESLKPNKIVARLKELDEADIYRPGEHYEHHRNIYMLKGHARTFFEVVAQVTGLPLKSVVRAVVHGDNHLSRLKEDVAGEKRKNKIRSTARVASEDLLDDISDMNVA